MKLDRLVLKHPLDEDVRKAPLVIATGYRPKPLHAAMQIGTLMLWVEWDVEIAAYEPNPAPVAPALHTLEVVAVRTGGSVPPGYTHLSTVLVGQVVWHIYTKGGI
jgi:hypothetical protein